MSTYRCVRSEVGATVYDEAMLSIDERVTTGGGSNGGPRARESPPSQPVGAPMHPPPPPRGEGGGVYHNPIPVSERRSF